MWRAHPLELKGSNVCSGPREYIAQKGKRENDCLIKLRIGRYKKKASMGQPPSSNDLWYICLVLVQSAKFVAACLALRFHCCLYCVSVAPLKSRITQTVPAYALHSPKHVWVIFIVSFMNRCRRSPSHINGCAQKAPKSLAASPFATMRSHLHATHWDRSEWYLEMVHVPIRWYMVASSELGTPINTSICAH